MRSAVLLLVAQANFQTEINYCAYNGIAELKIRWLISYTRKFVESAFVRMVTSVNVKACFSNISKAH